MNTVKLSPPEFKNRLKLVNRFWNGEEGLAYHRAMQKGLTKTVTHILWRRDGWSIACEKINYGSCYDLWPEEWETLFTLDSQPLTHTEQ